jgi:predicted ferric reductase
METRRVWPSEPEDPSQVRPSAYTQTPNAGPQAQQRAITTNYSDRGPVAPVTRPATPSIPPSVLNSLPMWGLIVAAVVGMLLAVVTIPGWVPVLGASMAGTEPTVYWYLSRASGFVAFALFWLSMASGLIIPNKMARVWPGVFTAFDLHQYTSLLALGFTMFHVLVLLGNQYVPYNLVQLFVPFVDAPYRPLWIALGQVGLYLTMLVSFTFYIRKQMGNRLWHIIHFLSYPLFAIALLHGLFSGTDSGNIWVLGMYWGGAASLLALTVHRFTMTKAATTA